MTFEYSISTRAPSECIYFVPEGILVTDGDGGKHHPVDVVLLDVDVLLELEVLGDAVHHVEHEEPDGAAQDQQPQQSNKDTGSGETY